MNPYPIIPTFSVFAIAVILFQVIVLVVVVVLARPMIGGPACPNRY